MPFLLTLSSSSCQHVFDWEDGLPQVSKTPPSDNPIQFEPSLSNSRREQVLERFSSFSKTVIIQFLSASRCIARSDYLGMGQIEPSVSIGLETRRVRRC